MSPSLSESKALTLSKTSLALRKVVREEWVFPLIIMPFKLNESFPPPEKKAEDMPGGETA